MGVRMVKLRVANSAGAGLRLHEVGVAGLTSIEEGELRNPPAQLQAVEECRHNATCLAVLWHGILRMLDKH
jgi:hypothetical protein